MRCSAGLGRSLPELGYQPWNLFKILTVAGDQFGRVRNTNCSDPQIVRPKTNPLLSPLLVERFCLYGIRQDVKTMKVRQRVLEQFIGSCETDVGSSSFGLPNNV